MRKFIDVVLLCSMMIFITGCDLFEKDYDQEIISTSTAFKAEGEYEYDSNVDKLYLNIDDIEYREVGNLMVTSVKVDLYEENNEEILDTVDSSDITATPFNLNQYLDNVKLSASFDENAFDLDKIYVEIKFVDSEGKELIERLEFKKDR